MKHELDNLYRVWIVIDDQDLHAPLRIKTLTIDGICGVPVVKSRPAARDVGVN
jgi:hypothetical protein